MLNYLQEELKKLWTSEGYSEEFRKRYCPQKDLDHALKHIRKATQAIENMTEEADHSGKLSADSFDVGKYLADIIISVVRAANVFPGAKIDLEKAILSRIQHKMGKRLEVMAACPSCGAVLQCNHHDSLGRCQCTGEFGPCCHCS